MRCADLHRAQSGRTEARAGQAPPRLAEGRRERRRFVSLEGFALGPFRERGEGGSRDTRGLDS